MGWMENLQSAFRRSKPIDAPVQKEDVIVGAKGEGNEYTT